MKVDRFAELEHQEEIWNARRQVEGHGALDVSGRPKNDPLIIMLGGPIAHWWDENWMTPEHIRYDEWRRKVCDALVAAGHLVYRPHEAFKGTWTNMAQPINDVVVLGSDVLVALTPDGVPSSGTDDEIALAEKHGRKVLRCPPPQNPMDDDLFLEDLINRLERIRNETV